MRRFALLGLISLPLVVAACSSDASTSAAPANTAALFVVPSSLDELSDTHFFDHPFPSDLRRDADGTAHFGGFPNPAAVPLLDAYVAVTKGLLHGFSPTAAIYLRFTGAIDPATLPADPPSSTAKDSSVQIVDVDPTSPEHGQRKLLQTRWQAEEGVYWQPDTLAVLPMIGRSLRPHTRYAVVVTNKVRAAGGAAIAPSEDLAETLGEKPATDRTRAAHDAFAPAVSELAAAGIAAADIAHLTVFTTDDPTEETYAIIDDVKANVPAPTAAPAAWAQKEQTATYDVYEGTYGPSPNYQAGTPPFAKQGGGFVFDGGKPVLQGTFDLRFALTVPNKCTAPAGGYPVVLYAHGTGGDYRSYIQDGTADALASRCLAAMGIDQIFHGTRPGAPPANDPQRDSTIQFLFFNFDNPTAARTSNRQAAIDVVQQARLFTASQTKVPAAIARTGQDIAFDPTKVMFFGHSQGGLNGPLFLAGSDLARGGVLSGAGSVIGLAFLDKTKPVDVAAAVRFLLGLSDAERAKELDVFHPAISLIQSLIDVADPINYAAQIVREPRAGAAPKSIYQTEGVTPDGTGDTYAPPSGIEALSVGIGLPRVLPGIHPIEAAAWAGLADVSIPAGGLSGDLAGGQATGVLAQFTPKAGSDGHFVVFDVPQARAQAATFLENLAADPKGRVSP
jgi:hypothetical protein